MEQLSALPFVVPDAVGYVTAWKALEADPTPSPHGTLMRSPTYPALWVPYQAHEAQCKSHTTHYYDPVPYHGCTCGIHGASHIAVSIPYGQEILVLLAMWGRVIEGSKGYRSQYAYPLAIYTDLALADYGVPIRPMNELPAEEFAHLRSYLNVQAESIRLVNLDRERRREWLRVLQEARDTDRVSPGEALMSRKSLLRYVAQGHQARDLIGKWGGAGAPSVVPAWGMLSVIQRPIPGMRNTHAVSFSGGSLGVRFYDTVIAEYQEEGIVLQTGGWDTTTTGERIDAILRAATDYGRSYEGRDRFSKLLPRSGCPTRHYDLRKRRKVHYHVTVEGPPRPVFKRAPDGTRYPEEPPPWMGHWPILEWHSTWEFPTKRAREMELAKKQAYEEWEAANEIPFGQLVPYRKES